MNSLKDMDLSKVARVIEKDAGRSLPGLRTSLKQAKTGEAIVVRRRGRPRGSTQTMTKEAVKLRLDADVVAALRASGDGWQTRINDTLRASLALSGKIAAA